MAKRKRNLKIYQRPHQKKKLFFILKATLGFFLLLFLAFVFVFVYYTRDFPRPEDFTERQFSQSTKIYDRTGKNLLYEVYGEEKRTVVPLNQIPKYLRDAVITAEDANFYHHHGIDLKGLARAILIDIRVKKPTYGGSTISQQLIRSTFLSLNKTLKRKTREIVLTLELERRYSKDQILEWYLNQIPFGANCYGVESASETYFKKPVSKISLPEAATLAALIRAPSYLSPYGSHKKELLERKDKILKRMAKLGFITDKELLMAEKTKVKFAEILNPIKAPHFVLSYILPELENQYGRDFLESKGLKVYTTLDWELQKYAEEVVKKQAEKNERYQAFNAALLSINPNTGEILAMVGSKDFFGKPYPKGCTAGKNCKFEPKFNVAVLGKRQPGSAFKPFAYTVAFKKGYTPDTVVWDVKTEFNPNCPASADADKDKYGLPCYHPQNYDKIYRGPVILRNALAQSINVPSVKVLYLAGIQNTIRLAKKMGITTLNGNYGLSLVLGGGEVKMIDMVSAYGVFATGGFKIPPVGILKIEDSKGNVIFKNNKVPERILDSQTCDLISDVLSDNQARAPLYGYHSSLAFEKYQVAAKTGTTQNYWDAWIMGYTPSIVTGIWVGNNDHSPMSKKPGIILTGPIFHQFMEKALSKYPPRNFEKPKPILTKKPVLNGVVDWKNPHSILYYVQKDNPQSESNENSQTDIQYPAWEQGIKNFLKSQIAE